MLKADAVEMMLGGPEVDMQQNDALDGAGLFQPSLSARNVVGSNAAPSLSQQASYLEKPEDGAEFMTVEKD